MGASDAADRDEAVRESPRRVGARVQLRRLLRQWLRVTSAGLSLLVGCCDRLAGVFDIVMKILGIFLVAAALGLIGFVSYTFFALWLPHVRKETADPFKVDCVATAGAFLLANLAYNYAMAVCTDPGLPPELDGIDTEPGAPSKHCQKCMRQKPRRTHHCSVCRRCVLRMDHHCPWINNCVGFRNHRYFCLFMLWLWFGCLFIEITFLGEFVESILEPRRSRLSFQARQAISLSWILALCISFAICLLGGFHVYLVFTNQTTIEFHTNLERCFSARRKGERYLNPYDLGASRNFKEIFGPSQVWTFCWLFPLVAKRPTGDGMHYTTPTVAGAECG